MSGRSRISRYVGDSTGGSKSPRNSTCSVEREGGARWLKRARILRAPAASSRADRQAVKSQPESWAFPVAVFLLLKFLRGNFEPNASVSRTIGGSLRDAAHALYASPEALTGQYPVFALPAQSIPRHYVVESLVGQDMLWADSPWVASATAILAHDSIR